jgi:methionine biosynthesis protein MetW
MILVLADRPIRDRPIRARVIREPAIPEPEVRADLAIVADLVRTGASVLDLGCGDGELLAHLQRTRQVHGIGLEIDQARITACLAKGVNVIEQDLNLGLQRFSDDAFDVVVMTETLQALRRPDEALREMLRVGRECVVTFPNFGHWRCRLALTTRGRMPVAKHLPHGWYDTPNIHLCTVFDFEQLCRQLGIHIVERFVFDTDHHSNPMINLAPNLFGAVAFYRLARR